MTANTNLYSGIIKSRNKTVDGRSVPFVARFEYIRKYNKNALEAVRRGGFLYFDKKSIFSASKQY